MFYLIKLFHILIIAYLIIATPAKMSFSSENPVTPKTNHNPIMRGDRELLVFDIYWLGIYVGRASLEAANNKGGITIISKVDSAPVISAFYKVEDYAKSEIANEKPVSFLIKQHEGRYRSNKETIFDYKNNKITYFNHLKGEKTEHNAVNKLSWDVISGFYFLRSFSFEVGKTVYISIFDSNKFYNAEIKVIGKEKISILGNREVNTIIIKPVLQSDGLFKKKGDILIWLTDDEHRIPVRVETSISIGNITARIKSIESHR